MSCSYCLLISLFISLVAGGGGTRSPETELSTVFLPQTVPQEDEQEEESRPLPTEEDLEFLRSSIGEAYRGGYRDGRRDLGDYLTDFPDSVDALCALGRLELLYGHLDKALERAEQWAKLEPRNPRAALLMAQVLENKGRYAEAEERLRAGLSLDETFLEGRAALARLLFERGKRTEARGLARAAIDEKRYAYESGDDMLALGRLYFVLGDLENAARAAVFADRAFNGKVGPNYKQERYEALLLLGKLYRLTRLDSGNRALKAINDALAINPNNPDALVERAETRLYGQKFSLAWEDCERALLLNSRHSGALGFKTRLMIRNGAYDDALESIEKGLEQNPRDKLLLSLKAASLYLQEDVAGCDAVIETIREIDVTYGAAFCAVGEALFFHHRLNEARDWLAKCLEIDPDCGDAYIVMGRILANLGLEGEAEKYLLESEERDPYEYPWRYNMLKILGELKSTKRVEMGNGIFSLDIDEWRVLEHYLPASYEKSWKALAGKYGFAPKRPILLEMFSFHQDFAVRSVGFTGLGALGVCFGDVVTILSPRCKETRHGFVWARTLHHELAHVFTLKLSHFRIPRWLTEGFSVFEEFTAHDRWDRDMDHELFHAWHNESLIPIGDFNRQITSGPRVLFAYFQAGCFVRFMNDTHGWDALVKILKAYARGLNTEEAFAAVLGEDAVGPNAETLDAAFGDWVEAKVVAPVAITPVWSDKKRRDFVSDLRRSPGDEDLLAKAAWASYHHRKLVDARYYLDRLFKVDPDNLDGIDLAATLAFSQGNMDRAEKLYSRRLEGGGRISFEAFRNLGIVLRDKGEKDEAAALFEKAIAAFPGFIGDGNAYELLAYLRIEEGKEEEARELLAQLSARLETDIEGRMQLAEYYMKADDFERAVALLGEGIEVDPFIRPLHVELGRCLHALGRLTEALQEFDVALLIDPGLQGDPGESRSAKRDDYEALASIHVSRATLLIDMDRPTDAKQDLEKALGYNPNDAEARKLLEKLGSS